MTEHAFSDSPSGEWGSRLKHKASSGILTEASPASLLETLTIKLHNAPLVSVSAEPPLEEALHYSGTHLAVKSADTREAKNYQPETDSKEIARAQRLDIIA
jgi:hypothetical protein